ncbi:hypothetical protein B0H19DRAFT_328098 [Mycena capillaripes]|nr:hypothetical protein B0H19DRAFT_328098 [Mycena capillaripes]
MDETPLMFRSTESNSGTTVFRARNLKERRTSFYLYDEPFNNLYCFEHAVKNGSAEEFIETVDWNKMTYLGSLKGPPLLSSMDGRAFGVGSRKCLLRDLGKIQHTPWKSEPRILRDACEQHRAIIQAASYRCFFIPDTQLPEPWTCDWANWSGWDSRVPLFYEVARWYNLPPLNAIMFHDWTTVFESSGVYYLYDLQHNIAEMYRFRGYFSTVEDFIDNVDWNNMERLEYSGACPDAGPSAHGHDPKETPVQSSGRGFCTASNEPYRERTLWAIPPKGSWGYEARILYQRPNSGEDVDEALSEWGSIPDNQLPEPWSCSWAHWGYIDSWLEEIMFWSYGDGGHGPMVVSTGGVYYFYGHELDRWFMRFDGIYASDEEFVENGDWNRLKYVEPLSDEE